MSKFSDLLGTLQGFFRIGLTGPRLINNSGNLRITNAGGTTDIPVQVSRLDNSGDTLVLNSDAANTGADRSITIARPTSGMPTSYTLTLPVDDGSPAQVLQTDGNGVTSWVSIAGTADKITTDTTSIAFGSTSPITMFTLPANAVIGEMRVIVDTAFNGAPSLSIGITGQTSKYFAASQVDLATVGKYEIYPNNLPGATENLIATYTAGGATAGAGRIEVEYAVPS